MSSSLVVKPHSWSWHTLIALLFIFLMQGMAFAQTAPPRRCDVNRDGVIDSADIALITAARNQLAASADDPRDGDGDGKITILDSRTCSARCTRPLCSAVNVPPVANAGADRSASVGDLIVLSGSGTDIEGATLTFAWTLVSKPAGSAAAIAGATIPAAQFSIDVPGTYTAQLIVNDGLANSVADTVVVSTSNTRPVANAGADRTALVGASVTLNGTGSSDPDGNAITFAWTLTAKPAGSAAALSSATASMPTFTLDRIGTYNAQLIVNDGTLSSVADEVVISTSNSTPVANAGPNLARHVGAIALLSGAASSDTDGQALTFAWSLVTRPAGSAAALANATSVSPSFTLDAVGTYIAQLIVNDGFVNSPPATVTISSQNTAPVANAGPDASVNVGSPVNISGAGSTDADGDSLSFQWSLASAPAGSTAALSSTSAVNVSFTANVAGTYVAQLIVSDGFASSVADTVVISAAVGNLAPVANAGANQAIVAGQTVNLNGSASSDPNGDAITFAWSFTSRPAGSAASLNNATSATPSFVADRSGTYVLQLQVSDGALSSTSTVTITSNNLPPVANAGPDQNVPVGASVALNGQGSSEADPGQSLQFSWTITSQPAGANVTLLSATTSQPQFTPTVPGIYVVQLIVSDGFGGSNADTVSINVSAVNQAPTLNPSFSPASPVVGQAISLNANAADANGDALTFAWSIASRPAGSAAALTSATVNPTGFTPDLPGTYNIAVSVNDGTVTVAGAPLVIVVGGGSMSLATASLTPIGGTSIATPTFSPPLAAPATIALSSSASGVASVPASVSCAVGASCTFNISGIAAGNATITASGTGLTNATGNTTVTNNILSIGATTLAPGASGSVPVSLSSPAPAGGLVVTLSSSNPAIATISPASITIAAGQVSASPNPTVTGVAPGQATLSASAAGFVSNTNVARVQLTATLSPSPFAARAGRIDPMTITLSQAAPAGGLTINLASSDATKATVPATVVVPAGNLNAQFNVTGVAPGSGVIVTASSASISTATATVNVAVGASFVNNGGFGVGFNAQVGFGGNLDTPAPAGGVIVTVTSGDPTKLLVVSGSNNPNVQGTASATNNVVLGQTSFFFTLQGLVSAGTVPLTFSAPGYASITQNVTLSPTSLRLASGSTPLNTSTTTANTNIDVCIGLLNAAGTPQSGATLRGGFTLPFTVSSSNTAVGVIVNANGSIAGAQDCASRAGGTQSAFDPVSAGTTTITVAQPAGMIVNTSNAGFDPFRLATVSAPSFIAIGAVNIGFNAQEGANAALDTPAPAGGLAVTITSSDPTRLIVAAGSNVNTLGTGAVTINVAAGQSNAGYTMQGLASSGSVTLTFSAPGYTSTTRTVNLLPTGLRLSGGSTPLNTSTTAANTNIDVCIGLLNAAGTPQSGATLRGGITLPFSVTSSNTAVGVIVNSPGVIAGGQQCSSSAGGTVAAFDPVSAGTTNITAVQPAGMIVNTSNTSFDPFRVATVN